MGTKQSPKEAALYAAVDEVLHYIWDPIGVRGIPQARDEYHNYLPQVFSLLRDGRNAESIADYLGEVTRETIGLSGDAKSDLETATVLIDWKEAIDGKFI
jgi:hypothetical protein